MITIAQPLRDEHKELLPHIDKSQPVGPSSGTPLEILKRRYVAGEITKEQFDEIKLMVEK